MAKIVGDFWITVSTKIVFSKMEKNLKPKHTFFQALFVNLVFFINLGALVCEKEEKLNKNSFSLKVFNTCFHH